MRPLQMKTGASCCSTAWRMPADSLRPWAHSSTSSPRAPFSYHFLLCLNISVSAAKALRVLIATNVVCLIQIALWATSSFPEFPKSSVEYLERTAALAHRSCFFATNTKVACSGVSLNSTQRALIIFSAASICSLNFHCCGGTCGTQRAPLGC